MQETEKINEYGFSPRFTETVRDVKNNILMIGMALLILAGMAFGAFLARDPDCLSYQGVSFIIKEKWRKYKQKGKGTGKRAK